MASAAHSVLLVLTSISTLLHVDTMMASDIASFFVKPLSASSLEVSVKASFSLTAMSLFL
jgi:hypothetical protein